MARTKQFDENEVLEKAVGQFWAKGYNGTSMQDLVASLGLSRSSIYDTYTDKRQLFITSLAHYINQSTEMLVSKIAKSEDLIKTIEEILLHTVNASEKGKACTVPKGCFAVNTITELSAQDAEIASILNSNTDAIINALYTTIRREQARGKISERHSPMALARFIHNNLTGVKVAEKGGLNPEAIRDIAGIITAVLKG